jgi:subtilisin family serine protease
MPMKPTSLGILLAAAAMPLAELRAQAPAPSRPVIEAAAQLPRKTYTLPKKPSEMLSDAAATLTLARQIDTDLVALMHDYDIRDRSAVADFQATRLSIALLEGRTADAVALAGKLAELQEKPAQRATAGLVAYGYLAAGQGTGEARQAAFGRAIAERLAGMEPAVVQARVKEIKRTYDLMSPGYYIGGVQAELDPVWEKSPVVGLDTAADIVRTHLTLARTLEYRPAMLAAFKGWIEKHGTSAPMRDVWTERRLELPAAAKLSPVTIAIWDTGVDPSLSTAGAPGLAFDISFNPSAGALAPIPPVAEGHMAAPVSYTKGFSDMQATIDSPAADALRETIGNMPAEQVGPFMERLSFYGIYSHGTHVASIAAEGNPAARILPVRISFPFTNVPPPITEEVARGLVRMAKASIAHMQSNRTRLANMSWGYTAKDVERTLELNNVEPDPEKRKQRAQAIFDIAFSGMRDAIATAPEILFVIAAGNTDEDIDFVRDMPGSIDLPNVLVVGASDSSGSATSFTSMGKSVALYANGYAVDGTLPGGTRMKLSGASMSAPQVVNAAAKLLALKPGLSTAALVQLLKGPAEPFGEQKLRLLNPKASGALLRKR